VALAAEQPDVFFIAESDSPEEDAPPNLWLIDRNFQVGFYAVGVLAGHLTQTGKIGYLGGLTLPFSYAEVHAMQQALEDEGLSDQVELQAVWVGDFNDPTAARELADAMIAGGVDVIVGSLNLGMVGVFEAAKNAEQTVYVTAKYTDKSIFAPDNFVSGVLYDWAGPLKEIVSNIQQGETGGYYPLGFATGVRLQDPRNVPDDVKQRVLDVVQQLESGEIEVVKNTDPIE
jgi:basic membrane protein A